MINDVLDVEEWKLGTVGGGADQIRASGQDSIKFQIRFWRL